uniref:Uncharacterized protein n=1 Tax=Ixodes scapularis TaxID=6945 RepID=A0A4D5RAJ3_IXOSC
MTTAPPTIIYNFLFFFYLPGWVLSGGPLSNRTGIFFFFLCLSVFNLKYLRTRLNLDVLPASNLLFLRVL